MTAQFDLLLYVNSMIMNKYFSFLFHLVDQLVFIGTNYQFILTAKNDKDPVVEFINKNAPIRNLISTWMAKCVYCSIIIIRLFMWNFLHILIMVISAGLSTHFKLINVELEQAIVRSGPIMNSHLAGVNSILEVNFQLTYTVFTFSC